MRQLFKFKVTFKMRKLTFTLDTPHPDEYSALVDVWESSVRATHNFLKKKDIGIFKKLIQEKEVFKHLNLTCARGNNNIIAGIMGVSNESLEMLFVHSEFIGRGVGKLLLLHAVADLNVTKVDVNEQNQRALKFYEHFGFKVTSRSELDETGKPYPILHMQREKKTPARFCPG
jgi:putative acetyltransferase